MRLVRLIALCLSAGCLAGCHSQTVAPPTTRMATDIDPATAKPDYWWSKPTTAHAESDSLDSLWAASRLVAIDNYFILDRTDYRDGLMTTKPLISKQFFEFWRDDTLGAKAVAESSLAAYRRTIRFEFARLPNGRYRVVPKVLIERYCLPVHRITSVSQYGEVFSPESNASYSDVEPSQRSTPPYWYAVGRDGKLESLLAKEIQHKS